jgi:hypothetical protein
MLKSPLPYKRFYELSHSITATLPKRSAEDKSEDGGAARLPGTIHPPAVVNL